jgi:hypothetical protein
VDPTLAFVQTEPETAEVRLNAAPRLFQKAMVIVEQEKIIDIPAVSAGADLTKNKLIQRVQIDVCEEL